MTLFPEKKKRTKMFKSDICFELVIINNLFILCKLCKNNLFILSCSCGRVGLQKPNTPESGIHQYENICLLIQSTLHEKYDKIVISGIVCGLRLRENLNAMK